MTKLRGQRSCRPPADDDATNDSRRAIGSCCRGLALRWSYRSSLKETFCRHVDLRLTSISIGRRYNFRALSGTSRETGVANRWSVGRLSWPPFDPSECHGDRLERVSVRASRPRSPKAASRITFWRPSPTD